MHGFGTLIIPVDTFCMGTVVAGDVFQGKLDEIYEGLPGVTGIADYIVIYGQTRSNMTETFYAFLT